MRRIIFSLLFVLMAVSAFAQSEVEYPDFNIGGSGGSGGSCYTCQGDGMGGNAVHCSGHSDGAVNPSSPWAFMTFDGYDSCVAHNVQVGPGYCETSGICHWTVWIASRTGTLLSDDLTAEEQVAGIQDAFLSLKLMSPAERNDFIAVTDYGLRNDPYKVASQKRLAAYRARFAALTGRELKPNAVPITPHPRAKAPAATIIAAR